MIEEARCSYSPLGEAFEKQAKTIKDQGRKQVEALKILKPAEKQKLKSTEDIFPKDQPNNEIKKEFNQIKIKNGKTTLQKRFDL